MQKEDFLKELGIFLFKASKVGYAAVEKAIIINEPDGSKTIVFEDGDWKFHDNYFGGEPYGGREVVFYKKQPVWMMVYYGAVTMPHATEYVYPLLQKALRACPEKFPIRGPIEPYQIDDFSWYIFELNKGSLEKFEGTETINTTSGCIYEGKFIGGLINQ